MSGIWCAPPSTTDPEEAPLVCSDRSRATADTESTTERERGTAKRPNDENGTEGAGAGAPDRSTEAAAAEETAAAPRGSFAPTELATDCELTADGGEPTPADRAEGDLPPSGEVPNMAKGPKPIDGMGVPRWHYFQ